MTTDEKDFLSRWSKRKQAAREGLDDPQPEHPVAPAQDAAEQTAEEAAIDESAFEDVDFDALDYNSDYTRFMGKDVPEMVRRRALRALWRSDPILANVDGLNDYDEDFTDAALVVENLASAYKPGKGYASEEDEAAEETQAAEAGAEAAPEPDPIPDEPAAIEQGEDAPLETGEPQTAEAAPAAREDGEPQKT